MARHRREIMSEGKKNIITDPIREYDIKSAEIIMIIRDENSVKYLHKYLF